MSAAGELVDQRIRDLAHTRLSDILEAAPHLRTLSPALEHAARARRAALVSEWTGDPFALGALAEKLAGGARDFLHREHQFLQVDERHEQALAESYRALLSDALRSLASDAAWPRVADELRAHLASHEDRVRALVALLLAECGSPAPGESGAAQPVCEEYSPELQLRVLGARAEELLAPLLDLGCGASAALVHHLRRFARGPVLGLDRSVPRAEGLLRASWFDVSLPPRTWRTVLAHHSFSLHFQHAHVHSASRARRFAEKYREILHSLVPGGRFLYAPALPFVESVLPSEFRAAVRPIEGTGFRATSVERLA
jgi:hypothetical protein